MRTPDFLIVGAMKSGTTTLFQDMLTHPRVWMPDRKETDFLFDDSIFTPERTRAYHALFAPAKPGQKAGEATTGYTKRPRYDGVAERALKVCGPELRILYIVRDPVERTLSHHYHNVAYGDIVETFEQRLETEPKLTDVSRYAYQIEPWIQTFGRDAVAIFIFEEYMRDREAGVRRAWSHLGLDEPEGVDLNQAGYNRGESRYRLGPLGQAVRTSLPYRKLIKPMLNDDGLNRVKRMFGRPVPPRPPRPSEEVLQRVRGMLAEDTARFHEIMGRTEPIWPAKRDDDGAAQPDTGSVAPAGA